ncbi:alpha amylase C-terminal domain-containing protein [bacterium]|nr:alpha amylase C-terminal domain-containing protein [bacterium]
MNLNFVSHRPIASAQVRDWRDEVMYFPLTDRYHDGDPANNDSVNLGDPLAFHGGDFAGIREKLDYIQETGATTLWLAPIQDNTNLGVIGDYKSAGYHGYWIRDHYGVEEHQGSLAEVKELVHEAKERGMRVVLDTVLNHVAPNHPWTQDPAKKSWFHNQGGIDDYNDQRQVEQRDLGGLPDLNQENPEVYNYLLENTAHWVTELGVDGVRLDAVKHVSKDFWSKFVPDLKNKVHDPDLFVLGEVLHGDVGYVADYQRAGIDHIFDIPMYYSMRDVFGNDGSCKELARRFADDHKYADPNKLVTLIDNHDFPRFMSTSAGDQTQRAQRLELAMTFLMTMRGTPSLYYGTETAMEGGNDPDNRRMMDFDSHPQVRAHFQQLSEIRAGNEALRRGQQLEMWVDDKLYAFARRLPGQEAITVINNGSESSQRQIPLREGSPLQEGQKIKDALSGREFTVKNGKVDVELPPRSALILVP